MLAWNGPTAHRIRPRPAPSEAPLEPGLSLEAFQRALQVLQGAPQLHPEARRRGIRALEKACSRWAALSKG